MQTSIIPIALALVGSAAAAAPSQIVGKLIDDHGRPLEAATITVGDQRVASTPAGVYRVLVAGPGTYKVAIDYADAHVERDVTVAGPIAILDSALPVDSEATIVIHDVAPMAVAPERSDDPNWDRQAPYSDEAFLSNRWAKAWLLLDVDDTGHVSRLKLLNDPGQNLGPIAIAEGFKMTFSPARDATNRPIPTLIVAPVEWPSYSWEIQRAGTASHFFKRREYMECRGHGPITMDSVVMEYRDCTPPDLANAPLKKWIRR